MMCSYDYRYMGYTNACKWLGGVIGGKVIEAAFEL